MKQQQVAKGSNWLVVALPLVGFVVVIAVALTLWLGQQGRARQHTAEVQEANAAAGLPLDFPSDTVPLYEGAVVKSKEESTAKSEDGQPMKMWKVVAEVDSDDRKAIFDYYNELLLDKDFRQTQYISMPSHDSSGPNFAVDYGNEEMSLSLVIEKKKSDARTQLEITIYRII